MCLLSGQLKRHNDEQCTVNSMGNQLQLRWQSAESQKYIKTVKNSLCTCRTAHDDFGHSITPGCSQRSSDLSS